MENIYNAIVAFGKWYWGIPIILILVVGGAYLSFVIRGIQFRELGHIIRSTIKKMFSREEKEEKKKGVTGIQTVLQAMGSTIGTGNVVGVGTAIAVGGPGAMFWMWVCGFLAMAVKYSETTLSVMYREKNQNDEGYRAGPFMYILKTFHSKTLAVIFGVFMIFRACSMGASHSKTVISAVAQIGIPMWPVLVIVLAFVAIQMLGGLKVAMKISDVLTPFMSVLYFAIALVVIAANIGNIGTVFVEIFKGAFTPTAAVGGFAGSTIALALRQGLARGVFSNDAGAGSQSLLHAQADNIAHPAAQGALAIFETFVDTIVICTLTGLMIIFTGVWKTGESGDTVVIDAASSTFGVLGKYLIVISIFLFALTSMNAICNSVKLHALTYFNGSKTAALIARLFYIAMLIFGAFLPSITSAFAICDAMTGVCLTMNVIAIVVLSKKLRAATDDYLQKYGRKAVKK